AQIALGVITPRIEPHPHLRRDRHLPNPPPERTPQHLVRVAVPVDGRRVEPIDPRIERRVYRRDRHLVAHLPPLPASDPPTPHPHHGETQVRARQRPAFHARRTLPPTASTFDPRPSTPG